MWVYEDKEVTCHDDLLPGCTDFVYLITYTNGKKYIGKKTVRSVRRLKPTKKQLAIRKNYARKELKDLPFVNYEGSSKLTEGLTVAKKEILYQTAGKTAATYIEVALLFEHEVLFNSTFVNENISGKFYGNALNGLLGERQ